MYQYFKYYSFWYFLGTIMGGFIIPDKYITFYLIWLPFLFLAGKTSTDNAVVVQLSKCQSGKPSNDSVVELFQRRKTRF